jgi:hypothetical protein
MNAKLKEFITLFVIQVISYSLLCINFRAVAQAHYIQSAITDFIIATLSFFVIRKIAKSEDTFHGWAGYAFGGVVGSFLGIWLSKILLGS